MIQKKIIKILQLIVGVAKYCRVSMRCTKFRFPIGVIVIDQLELVSFLSKGLTLSTASLVVFPGPDYVYHKIYGLCWKLEWNESEYVWYAMLTC